MSRLLSMMSLVLVLLAAPAVTLAGDATPAASPAPAATPLAHAPAPGTEILWDTWGVPHVFAPDAPSLFYGYGWAQARNHGDLLLRLYAQARGEAASLFGEAYLPFDVTARTLDFPGYGERWLAEQDPAFRANLDAFAAGINAYAAAHPEAIADEVEPVLPVSAADTLAHTARLFASFLAGADAACSTAVHVAPWGGGSNGWAVAPPHAAGGTLLLANPHLAWGGMHTFFEAQLSAPGVYDVYGATLLGIPAPAIAFNDRLGWTHTVNTLDGCDIYLLDAVDGGYRVDGETIPYESTSATIQVRQEDGALRDESVSMRLSEFGPVFDVEGAPVAVRMPMFTDAATASGSLAQWWEMGRAQDLPAFEAALARQQLPLFTVIYADADGHVMSLFNGQAPVRPGGTWADWQQPRAGDTFADRWTAIEPYEALPKVLDPPSGWVQNSNSPPWYATYPLALDPADFASSLAPEFMLWRERRGIRLLDENPGLTLERMIALKHDTGMELADRVVDDLVAAARDAGDADAIRAAEVLDGWDRSANPDSAGAVLFSAWVAALPPEDLGLGAGEFATPLSGIFATAADPAAPLSTPDGLADPAGAVAALVAAAQQVESTFGRLDVAWGDVFRLRLGPVDEPANGAPGDPLGVFRTLFFDESGTAVAGDTYIAAVEFGDETRARVLMTYGNASQPGSPHVGDQLALSAAGELRPAWRTRAEIEANLAEVERLGDG